MFLSGSYALVGVCWRGAARRFYSRASRGGSLRAPRSLSLHECSCFFRCAHANGVAVRHQRSTSNRIRDSSWKAKVEQYDKLVRKQAESTEAARRRHRHFRAAHMESVTTSAGSWHASNSHAVHGRSRSSDYPAVADLPSTKKSTTGYKQHMNGNTSNNAHRDDDDDGDAAEPSESASHAEVTESDVTGRRRFYTGKERGLLSFLGFKASKPMPINPLILAEWTSTGKNDPNMRATERLIYTLNELRGVGGDGKKSQPEIRLSEAEQRIILNRYVENKWYGHIFQRFNNIPLYRIRIARNTAATLGGVFIVLIIGMFCYLYYKEMECVLMMSDEDRRDYVFMVMSMRYSDIVRVGMARVNTEDPLGALPDPARMHIVVEACREKGWHTTDWERELRVMHPLTAIEECDYEHIIYWMMMYVGKFLSFSGSYFSDQFYNLSERRDQERKREQREEFTQAGPIALPEKKSRWERFFSL